MIKAEPIEEKGADVCAGPFFRVRHATDTDRRYIPQVGYDVQTRVWLPNHDAPLTSVNRVWLDLPTEETAR